MLNQEHPEFRIKVTFDMDDVLVDTMNHWLDELRARHFHEFHRWHFTEWGIEKKMDPNLSAMAYGMLSEFGFFRFIPINPNLGGSVAAQLVIKTLAEDCKDLFEVGVCSAPPVDDVHENTTAYRDKVLWLRDNMPWIEPKNYAFMKNKGMLNSDILIDDGYHNADNYRGIFLLADAPWNQHIKDHIRITDFSQVLHLLHLASTALMKRNREWLVPEDMEYHEIVLRKRAIMKEVIMSEAKAMQLIG